MRESKFRGKRIDNGEWVYGFYDGCYDSATINYLKNGTPWNACVDPETVGEFTGLLDKNGVEVYDDDIYRNLDTNLIGKLTVGIGVGGIYVLCTEYKDGHIYNNLPFAELDTTSFEVIGNIHDNPKLLMQNSQQLKGN